MTSDNVPVDQRERSTSNPTKSPVVAATGAAISAMSFVVWLDTGHLAQLFAAIAFAAMAPCWYIIPISWTGPIGEHWRNRPKRYPRWAQVLTVVGVIALGMSVALRWMA